MKFLEYFRIKLTIILMHRTLTKKFTQICFKIYTTECKVPFFIKIVNYKRQDDDFLNKQ